MEKIEMFNYYEKFNKAEKYIIGFTYQNQVYMETTKCIDPNMITLERASRNQGMALRFRPKAAQKATMALQAICLGALSILLDEKYNKGEMFEKIVTEHYGQKWTKDNVPFYKDGDIAVNGEKIQIKFEQGTFCTNKIIEKLL